MPTQFIQFFSVSSARPGICDCKLNLVEFRIRLFRGNYNLPYGTTVLFQCHEVSGEGHEVIILLPISVCVPSAAIIQQCRPQKV